MSDAPKLDPKNELDYRLTMIGWGIETLKELIPDESNRLKEYNALDFLWATLYDHHKAAEKAAETLVEPAAPPAGG